MQAIKNWMVGKPGNEANQAKFSLLEDLDRVVHVNATTGKAYKAYETSVWTSR